MHQWLNFRQGMIALLGVAIAAIALSLQFQPKPDDSGSNTTNTININHADPMVSKLVEILAKQLNVKDDQLGVKEQKLAELTKAVAALVSTKNEPNAPKGIDAALADLFEGDSEKAEAIFQALADIDGAERKEIAEAYRHLGALAYLHDTDKAINAYRRSAALDPDYTDSASNLDHLLQRTDDLNANTTDRNLASPEKFDSAATSVGYGTYEPAYHEQEELDMREDVDFRYLQMLPMVDNNTSMQSWMTSIEPQNHLIRFADPFYILAKPITWMPDSGPEEYQSVTVPKGYVTDFSSMPQVFWSILVPDENYIYAAIVHDYLYWTQTRSRSDADSIFRVLMEEIGIDESIIGIIYSAVRIGGDSAWSHNTELRELGERRILMKFPQDAQITWEEWKYERDVF